MNVTPMCVGNMYEIAKTVRTTCGVPLSYIIVQRIIPFGGDQNTTAFAISREHAERALVEIERIDRELGMRISVEDPFPLCVLPERLRKYMTPCAWGFTKVAVNDKGCVLPASVKNFAAGGAAYDRNASKSRCLPKMRIRPTARFSTW